MKRGLCVIVPIILTLPVAAQELPSPQDLLSRARATRKQARKRLAEAKTAHLQRRKELAAKLQKAYENLDAARAEAKETERSLESMRQKAEDLRSNAAMAERRTKNIVTQLAELAGASIEVNDSIAAVEQAAWDALRRRMQNIRNGFDVTVGPENIVARDGGEQRVTVLHLGDFAAYACGDNEATLGLLGKLPDGSMRVTGQYVPEDGADTLHAAADGELAHLPLDVDGSLVERSPSRPWTMKSWISAGGLFIYPIIVVGAVGIILIIERVVYLVATKAPPSLVNDVLARVGSGRASEAHIELKKSYTPTARVLRAGIDSMGADEQQRDAAMETALLAEAPKLERSLSVLAALAGVAPLLGLLGTVSGMIATFDTISTAGTGNPRLLSGGISEALITTQFGLMVAIPLLLAHAGLARWVERREALLEHDAIRVFGLNHEDSSGRDK